jgi:hypothetical protein
VGTLKNRIGLLVVVAGLATFVAAGSVGAEARSRRLAGTWSLTIVNPAPTCTESCIVVAFRGAINGNGEGPGATLSPATPPPYLFGQGNGDITIHTFKGDVFLQGSVIFNPTDDGEFAFLFRIVGGTGVYEGATGWIGSVGEAEIPGLRLVNQRYEGRLHLA